MVRLGSLDDSAGLAGDLYDRGFALPVVSLASRDASRFGIARTGHGVGLPDCVQHAPHRGLPFNQEVGRTSFIIQY